MEDHDVKKKKKKKKKLWDESEGLARFLQVDSDNYRNLDRLSGVRMDWVEIGWKGRGVSAIMVAKRDIVTWQPTADDLTCSLYTLKVR